ncbi:hypothetical protein MMC06_000165 [Schaereria dolodes]|nr:hypothetical protein [Schaereria dolodes]
MVGKYRKDAILLHVHGNQLQTCLQSLLFSLLAFSSGLIHGMFPLPVRLLVFSSAAVNAAVPAFSSAHTSAKHHARPIVNRVEHAIVPTSRGQIGVNPIISDFGPAAQYTGWIGVDTAYLTQEPSSISYIGPNPSYLTMTTIATTANNKPSDVVSTVEIKVETATASLSGPPVGSVGVLLPATLGDALRNSVSTALTSCAATKKMKRSGGDVMACLADFANTAANDGTFDATNAQAWSDFALEAAHNAPQVWLNAIQVAKTQAIKNKLILFMTAIPVVAAGIKTYKYNIPQEGAGAPTVSIPPQPSSTTSTTKCDPSQPKNQNSPLCQDTDCVGQNGVCSVDPNKDCKCLDVAVPVFDQFNTSKGDSQQDLLHKISDVVIVSPPPPPPPCFVNTNGLNFQGKPADSPASWCVCNDQGLKLFATMTSTESPCAFSVLPTATITVSHISYPPPGSPTSCSFVV